MSWGSATSKVLAWLKKYWIWILLPVGLLLLVAQVISAFRGKGKVIAVPHDGTLGPAIAQKDQEVAEKVQEAEAKAQEQIKEIEKKHEAVIVALDTQQKDEYQKLKSDPKALTAWLLAIGKGSK